MIRYDPADLAEIRAFYHDCFLCRAICQELTSQTISRRPQNQKRRPKSQWKQRGDRDSKQVYQ